MILDLVKVGASLIDKLIPDKEAAAAAKLRLLELEQEGTLSEMSARRDIIVQEAKSEHVLTATWRPITMLVFVALVAAHWFGFTAPNLGEAERLLLLEIIKLSLAGYVFGRSGEKAVKAWKNSE